MTGRDRRDFLRRAGTGAAVLAAGSTVRAAEADRVVLGVLGTGGMGTHHVTHLAQREDVEVAWVCDVDAKRLARAAEKVESATGRTPRRTGDLRKVLDDPRVDAVFVATPDHWHTPAALLALAAGKHVYVEKPCSHNVREGRALVDAAERSGRLVQVGTQSRSTDCVREAIQRVREGEIGEVRVAKAWNSQRRSSIGHARPTEPPSHLDFDTWLGPAPKVPYQPNLLHAVWRWWHAFGCGDIGNDGVHDIDVALWGLAPETHPERVACLGGTYHFDDDQQFPDTQYAVCEYPADDRGSRRQLVFEQRIWSPYRQDGYWNGAAFYGTEGVLIIGHTTGWRMYGPRNELRAERTGRVDLVAHHTNFLDAVRGSEKSLNAPALAGHRAATIVHLCNIAARIDRVLSFDPGKETITGDDEANAMLGREYRTGHWAVPAGLATR